MEKLNELELKKAELEKAFEEKKKQAQALTNDIAVMEQLIMAKRELNKVTGELNGIVAEHGKVCAEIEAEKAKESKPVEEKEEAKK